MTHNMILYLFSRFTVLLSFQISLREIKLPLKLRVLKKLVVLRSFHGLFSIVLLISMYRDLIGPRMVFGSQVRGGLTVPLPQDRVESMTFRLISSRPSTT